MFDFSRSTVSRLLSLARSKKIVDIKISDSPLMISSMQDRLMELLNIDEVFISSSEDSPQQTIRAIGNLASDHIDSILAPNLNIGIAWGTTVNAVVTQLKPTKKANNSTVIQLGGGIATPSFLIDAAKLTQTLAEKLNANYYILQAPQLVSNKNTRDLLLREPEFISHFKHFSELDIAIIGISSMRPEKNVTYKAGYITLQEAKELADEGFATDLCGNRIYRDGSIRHNMLTDRLIAIPPEQLRAVPRVIAVAEGSDKASTIITAAKGGFINTLITDEIAAIAIISMFDATDERSL
jgi:DNA-binding transcriptional regulator LsrR (DeoR family)